MDLSAGTEQLLQIFIILAGVLLIPVMLGIMVVLFKLAFLLHSTSEFLTLATYEISPMLKDVRLVLNRVEDFSARASSGVQDLGSSLQQAGPWMKDSLNQMRDGAAAMMSGIRKSVQK